MRRQVMRLMPQETPPAPEPAAPVTVDNSTLIAAVQENTAMLAEVLAELKRRKSFTFAIAKDPIGRLMGIDAKEI